MYYYEIAIPAPVKDFLTYSSLRKLNIGDLVEVPLRSKTSKGVVIKESSKPNFKTKGITEASESFNLDSTHLKWLLWIANYYMYPPGLVIHSVFPPLKQKETPLKETKTEEIFKHPLTNNQQTALNKILPLNGFKAHLLHGVTGSGKTEIYMELFEDVIFKQKKQGLLLLPEISLTPQLEKRFIQRFGNMVSSYHSQLTSRQKTNVWHDFMNEKIKILIGPRSSLFCPSKNIGLIVVDEEHESSFKQEEKFLYNARDAALKLAHLKNIPIILGSATPSLETFKNINKSKINYVRIKEKVFNQSTPKPKIIDMTEKKHTPFWLSEELKNAIENHLARKKQVALFLNRRGWSSFIQCYDCGYNFKCANCDISLTLHNKSELFCHYCGYGDKIPQDCPDCGSEKISKIGLGTEQVYNDILELFPQIRVLKFDRDEINTKKQLTHAITQIENHDVDLVIGTQMISKGLDFTNLTLMGILDADQSFSFPDFRASEKSIQQLNQVLGRVGRRKGQEAEVIIQTRSPEHSVFEHLDEKKFEDFAQEQLLKRSSYNYPPYSRMVAFLVKSKVEKKGEALAGKIANLANNLKKTWNSFGDVSVLGPCPSPIKKIRNEYRFQVILKFPENLPHQEFAKEVQKALGKLPSQTKVSLNVDPVDLM